MIEPQINSKRGLGDGGQSIDSLDFLAGGGLMEARIRAYDWEKSALGPARYWPQSLKTALKIALNSRYPIWMGWGADFIKFYNDPYIPVLGKRDQWALGAPAQLVWQEIWDEHLGPQARAVMNRGEASWNEQRQMVMYRNGFAEETYFTFSFSPLPADNGGVGGLFCACTEDTQRVLGERRLAMLSALAAVTADARAEEDAALLILNLLADHDDDIAFAVLYLLSPDGLQARRVGGESFDWSPAEISLEDATPAPIWPLSGSKCDDLAVLRHLDLALPGGRWPEPATTAAVLPLAKSGSDHNRGFLVVGASPRLPFDHRYEEFFRLLARGVSYGLSNARAFEEEKRRAEALAELDRAKTRFFSNVSHEFRTPLTLMLGPIEDMLSKSFTELAPATKGQLEIVHRNSLRLLKLVNTMLDFARIEAGRMQASFEQVDLPTYTTDLASVFRSSCERAGIKLIVDCPPLPAGVTTFVDRDLWEKIVLNLLSNAFKFTLEGKIEVMLRLVSDKAELIVSDSGTGIPAEELPRLFERFHRVPNAKGRTHEGSGIGLALVAELAKVHGGVVAAESKFGEGSRFTVSIPVGSAHLDPSHVRRQSELTPTLTGAAAYVEEISRWLPDSLPTVPRFDLDIADQGEMFHVTSSASPSTIKPRIVWADDNADMRDYVARLLSERFDVESVADGEAALAACRASIPDLVLSDVMMPRLDGFGLIAELRGEPALSGTPVILLSARAGEEARIEGAEAGADDYLTKPFSARELLARVEAHTRLTRFRRELTEKLRHSEARFRNMADHAPVMVWVTEPDGSCTFLSRSWYQFTGQTPKTGLGFGWFDAVHPDDRQKAQESFAEATRQQQAFQLEYRLHRSDGSYAWVIDAAAPWMSDAGAFAGFIGSVIDITDRKRAEDTQTLLVHELNHRVKNMLAVIQAIAGQTLRETTDPATFKLNFTARIAALARAHGVLTEALWRKANLATIVAAALQPFHLDGRLTITSSRHIIAVAPNAGLTLSMIIHELATNAAKYGALSNRTGQVAVSISADECSGPSRTICLDWRETNGPLVNSPARKGFGSRLISASAEQLGADVALDYAPEGVRFRMVFDEAQTEPMMSQTR